MSAITSPEVAPSAIRMLISCVRVGDIEAYRHHRRAQKRSAVTINHDLKPLRRMFAWGNRKRMLTGTPFREALQNAIRERSRAGARHLMCYAVQVPFRR